MRVLKTILICAVCFFLLSGAAVAGPKTETALKGELRTAERALAKAEARVSEASHVLSAFRAYRDQYGASVGRWVWLARDVGWRWSTIPNLMYIIYRESRGVPTATNSSSSAAGLLQFMPQWYNGLWSLPAFDPYVPRINLSMGLTLYKEQGWQPWAL